MPLKLQCSLYSSLRSFAGSVCSSGNPSDRRSHSRTLRESCYHRRHGRPRPAFGTQSAACSTFGISPIPCSQDVEPRRTRTFRGTFFIQSRRLNSARERCRVNIPNHLGSIQALKTELQRLIDQQKMLMRAAVFGGMTPEEQAAYDERQTRIAKLIERLSALERKSA